MKNLIHLSIIVAITASIFFVPAAVTFFLWAVYWFVDAMRETARARRAYRLLARLLATIEAGISADDLAYLGTVTTKPLPPVEVVK